MDIASVWDSELFAWVVIPALIFLARVADVSMGTLRIMFVNKGFKYVAPVLGFFEILIWLLAIGQIMQNLTSWINYVAYAGGFAAGNFVGMYIESKLSLGFVILRVITRKQAILLKAYFKKNGHRYTILDAESDEGPVNIIFTVLKRRDVPEVIGKVRKYNPQAFYTLEDIRSVSGSVFSHLGSGTRSYPVVHSVKKGK